MVNKSKKIFIITITLLMLIGLTTITATNIDEDDTAIITETTQPTIDTQINFLKDTSNVNETSSSQRVNIQETNNTQETLNNKNGEKTQNLKAGRTVNATNFNDLNSYLTSDAFDTVIINIDDDIQLEGNITVNNGIKNLTINGNGKIINGTNSHVFLDGSNLNIILNDIIITQTMGMRLITSNLTINNSNCTDNSYGVIYADHSTVKINNSNFTYNNKIDSSYYSDYEGADCGGVIYDYYSEISIANSNFLNNSAVEGTVIWGLYAGNYYNITNCNFKNNGDDETYSVIYIYCFAEYSQYSYIIDGCNFSENANNVLSMLLGYDNVELEYSEVIINNSIFTNNVEAVGITTINFTMNNCNFTDNNFSCSINANNSVITNCNFINDTAVYDTCLFYGNTSLINCNFTDNSGTSINTGGNITINNTNFLNNTQKRGNAGAISGSHDSNMTITNCTFINNTANRHGGAIYGFSYFKMIITNCTFINNTANDSGGVIYGHYKNTISITQSNLINNNVNNSGGAIYGYTNNTITINKSNLTNNNATNGGAIFGYINNTITIIQSNLTNNTANNSGGLIKSDTGRLTLINSNIANNHITGNDGYVIDFYNTDSIIITATEFVNNTDDVHDMLFSNAKTNANVYILYNTYIDNLLDITIIKPNVTDVSDNQERSYEYNIDLDLHEIYKDTVRSGTLNVYVNGVLKNTSEVTNGSASIFFENSDLTKKENNITLEYITQSKHYQNTTINFTVKKEVNTTLSIQAPSTMKAGEKALINFTLVDVNNNPVSDETISVLVDGQLVTLTTDSNGLANYTFNAFGDELVDIMAKHDASNDSFYNGTQYVGTKIDVNKIKPEIVIEHGNITPQIENNITIQLLDDNRNPIKNKTLTVNITEEGKPDITGTVITDADGIAVFNFTPTDEGTLNITVTSPSDDIYNYTNASVQASKNFLTTNITVNAGSMKINQTTINVEILPIDALLNGTVKLNISGEIHNITINNGRATYNDYKPGTAGEKLITAKFTSNTPGYANATTTTMFNVEKLPTRVTIEAINNTIGNVTLKVQVFPEEEIPSTVNGGNIVIESVDEENRTVIYNDTLQNGELIYLTGVNETGRYEFATKYYGNDYFIENENKTEPFEVLLIKTSTVTFDKTALIGDTITLNATVTDEYGNPVNDGNVTFIVNNSQLYHANGTPVEVQVENGIATIEYTLPTTYTKGNYIIKANYRGNNKYNSSSNESELSIDLHDTSMTITPLNNTKANTTILVTLNSTKDNKPIPNTEIIIKDENSTMVGKNITDENGTAIITIDIPVGYNNITISYPGDDIYKPKEETILINVTPRESRVNTTITNNTVGNVSVKVQVVDSETGEPVTGPVNIIIDDEIVGNGTLDNEGKTNIPVGVDNKGNYTIIVEYKGNDNYTGSTDILDNTYITGKQADINIIIDNQTIGNTTINVTITDSETDELIPNATIIVTLPNGTNITETTDKNGTAIITIDIPVGDNNITITYPGNETYNPNNKQITLIVHKIQTITTTDILNNTLGNVTLKVTVTNSTDEKVNQGTITVLNNDNLPIAGLDQVALEEGEITIKIPSSQAGENITITVRYNENDIYNSSIATDDTEGNPLIITVQPHDSRLTANVINGTTPTVKVNLTDDDGEAIPNAPIIITDENATVIANGTTEPDGSTTIPVPLPVGNHNITVSYPGDNNHKPTNKTVPVTVEKHNTTLNVTPENGTVIVNATNENGTPIPNLPINITDENATVIANGTTNENGIVIIPVPLEPGDHNITITTQGDENNTGTNKTIPITIPPKDTNMTIDVTNGSNPTVKVNLTDDEGKPIPNAPIIITDENATEIANRTTDENGTATIPVPLPTGENNITVSYPGNTTYKPQKETVTVNATPKESKTTGTITNNTVGNVTIDVQVVDLETGKPLTGPVKIIINGNVAGNGTLNDEGKTTIPVDIDKKGNYTIVIEYEGNEDYNRSNDTLDDVYIKGTDVDMNIIIDNPVVGETEVIITIVDPETSKPIPNAPITIIDENGTPIANGTTDENGTTTIPVDLPSGDNNITISYTGDNTREDKEEKITIRVKAPTNVTVDPVEGVVLDNVTFTANVVDYQGNKVNGGYVIFKVGGKTLTYENGTQIRTPVTNGIAKLSYKAENAWIVDSHPNLSVQAVYAGTSMASQNRSNNSKITIYKRNATVQVNAPDDYVNGTLHIGAVVRDQNGSLINGGNIVFKLNGLSLKDENNKAIVAQVINGKVHIDVKLSFSYSAKKYNLTAVYSNKIYNKATGTNTTTLKAIPTYINATVTIKDEFSKPVVTGQIYNKFNDAILEGTAVINIKFDGISYAKKVKVNNGTFSETLEGISIYKPGTHKVNITAGSNSHYQAVRETITSKSTPKYNVNTEFINITRNNTTTRVQAKIVDDKNNNVQKDLKITIKLNGKSFLVNQRVTNGNVDVLVDTSTLKNRSYSLELVSGANTYYKAGSATTELQKY